MQIFPAQKQQDPLVTAAEQHELPVSVEERLLQQERSPWLRYRLVGYNSLWSRSRRLKLIQRLGTHTGA